VRELVGVPEIVGVEERDEGGLRVGDAEITRGRDAGMAAQDDAKPRIRDRREQCRRRVGGSVVHDDALEIGHRLPQHAGDCIADRVGAVVRGNDH